MYFCEGQKINLTKNQKCELKNSPRLPLFSHPTSPLAKISTVAPSENIDKSGPPRRAK